MRMPSKPGVPDGAVVLSHPGPVRGESTERNSRPFQTETSCCEPGQATSAMTSGFSGSEVSMTRNPS